MFGPPLNTPLLLHYSGVTWDIGARGGQQFFRPKSHKMPDASLSPHSVSPFCRPILIAVWGGLPLPPPLVTIFCSQRRVDVNSEIERSPLDPQAYVQNDERISFLNRTVSYVCILTYLRKLRFLYVKHNTLSFFVTVVIVHCEIVSNYNGLDNAVLHSYALYHCCLLYTSPSPRD